MPRSGSRPLPGPPFAFTLIWLVYMLFPVYYLLDRPWDEQAVGFPLLAVFSVLYVYAYRRKKGRFLSVLAQIAIVGYFSWRWHVNFLYMGFYPSPIIGMLTSWKEIAAAFSSFLSMFVIVGWHDGLLYDLGELLQMLPGLLIMLFMPVALKISRRSKDLRDRLDLAHEEIARLSKIEERQRISRDLHDTLGHTLSLITLKSELAEKLLFKQPDRAAQEIRDIQTTSRAALKQVRELVSGMNASSVRDEIAHARRILAAAGMELELKGFSEEGPHPGAPLVDNVLGMCLREAVTNVVKHSKARNCTIEWRETEDLLQLSVADNGVGAGDAACMGDDVRNGLKGMRDRLRLLEGDLHIETPEGLGTRVVFRVPRLTKALESEALNG